MNRMFFLREMDLLCVFSVFIILFQIFVILLQLVVIVFMISSFVLSLFISVDIDNNSFKIETNRCFVVGTSEEIKDEY